MHTVKAKIGKEKYRTVIETDTHSFVTDEPMSLGGKDLGPDPGELLSSSLAACSAATIKMYADRKGWELEEAVVEVDFKKIEKTDTTQFSKKIYLSGNLDEEQKKRLHEIASKCPIHRLLMGEINIDSEL
ncbi:OsmC family protein [Moheibacter lacus]|uniref:OsmC family protein n=1 Tax=Moheibacter lacus TaxID=2745851 RepID=A0A838ZP80_9FLAO|nr:OsmC family protein [Moheibacter lacus]MBA5628585.1 OsmC family protein [Moheibacter lacus]